MLSLLLFTLMLAPASQAEERVSIPEIEAALERRVSKYHNMRFTYSTKEHLKPGDVGQLDAFAAEVPTSPQEWRNELSIMSPKQAGVSRPWKLWKRFKKATDGQWVLDRAISFDGTKSLSYVRSERIGEGNWNSGRIVGFEEPQIFHADVFEHFLSLGLGGPSVKFMFDSDIRTDFGFQVAEARQLEAATLYRLSGKLADFGTSYDVELRAKSGYLVTRWKADVKEKPGQLYEVKKVSSFNGVPYPASGFYRQWPHGRLNDHTYEFSVDSVEELTEDARVGWELAWPPGTIVENQINATNFTVPHER